METRRLQTEVDKRPLADLVRRENPLGRRVVQKLQASRDALLDVCRHVDPLPTPAARDATKGTAVRPRGKIERCDVVDAPVDQQSGRLEAAQSRLRALALERQQAEESRCEHRCACPATILHARRRHQTKPPSSATEPGSRSTVAMKIQRTCAPVNATIGSTSTGGFMVGAFSSCMSQA